MRDLNPIDLPVLEPTGAPLPQRPATGPSFSRSYRASLDKVVLHWCEPALHREWIAPMSGSRFTLLLTAPAYLEAEETDGMHTVRILVAFEDDGELTTMRVRTEPLPPLSAEALIASGYADRWEARLYALTDLLHA